MKQQLIQQIQDLQNALSDVLEGGCEVMNFKQCLKLTGFSNGYLYKLTSERTIPHYKRGKFVFFNRNEVKAWLLENKVETIEEIKARIETDKKKGGSNGKH